VPIINLPRGFEIAVENQSGQNRVVMVELPKYGPEGVQILRRYYASKPGTTIVVDTVGEVNPPPDIVVILDASCAEMERVGGDLTGGALIILDVGGHSRLDLGREWTGSRRGPDEQFGQPTCEAAAAEFGL
jgi:hypothetical protein